ncbi:DksA/TraR family C4-type zinc finger protein [Halomonas sp. MA07-2]|uniref:DksA/TraR family C4-type zinc finger protein n=1 Tax=unclassified Halomonas TaxID=2609666 RepID=UPI003EE8B567
MAGGWTRDGAVQDQIDVSIDDAVQEARSRLPSGNSFTHCEECGAAIPDARQKAVPGIRSCVTCQSERDEEQKKAGGGINRRGSKDSQLR